MFQGAKTGSGNITVADGAALGVTATGTQVTPATLTVGTSGSATLEFNNVNSTTTAPLAAGTLSAAGTITINVNSGTFTSGRVIRCSPGPAVQRRRSVSGLLNGALATSPPTATRIQLNITATALHLDRREQRQLGHDHREQLACKTAARRSLPTAARLLFDDTATGTTNVTVNALCSADEHHG